MSEMKYARELALQIEEQRMLADGKYVMNEHNMEKFGKVYDFFCALADDDGGKVRGFDIRPEYLYAEISIEVSSVDLHRDEMKQFLEVLQYVDVLDIKATTSDGLLICANVKNLWEAVE